MPLQLGQVGDVAAEVVAADAAVTEPGDVIWEPFGGLCSASLVAVTLGRRAFAAETDPVFADLAAERLARWP